MIGVLHGQGDPRVSRQDRSQGRKKVKAHLDAGAGKGDGHRERAKAQTKGQDLNARTPKAEQVRRVLFS
jgi:hypothetical protein